MRLVGAEDCRNGRCSFTLIELLVVMVLILLMYFVMFSPGSKPYQEKQLAACQKNLQRIHVALKIYANDHDGVFPYREGAVSSEQPLSMLVPQSTSVTEMFICPGSGDSDLPEAEPFADGHISYAYMMGLTSSAHPNQPLVADELVDVKPKAKGDTIFSVSGEPPGNNHRQYGGNVLFCDGRVAQSAPELSLDLTNSASVVILNPKP